MKTLTLIALTSLLFQCGMPLPPQPPPTVTREHSSATLSSDPPCDKELWKHTYGAMKRFGELIDPQRPYDRTVLKHRCVTVRGLIKEGPYFMKDGDVKWKIEVEPLTFAVGYYKKEDILKPENKGLLTIELVCGTKVTNLGCEECKQACAGYKARYSEQTRGSLINTSSCYAQAWRTDEAKN